MTTTLEVWLEFASTYSYPAAERVEALAREAELSIRWRPFLLGPIFHEMGWNDSPFNLYPAKGRYMWRDLERRCRKYGLPFRRPSHFPRSGLTAARMTLAVAEEPWCGDFIRAVYRANFADDLDITDWDVLVELLRDLGQDPEPVVARARSAAIREALKEQTARAQELGIFGAPSFVVDGELFWGHDRIEDALQWARDGKL